MAKLKDFIKNGSLESCNDEERPLYEFIANNGLDKEPMIFNCCCVTQDSEEMTVSSDRQYVICTNGNCAIPLESLNSIGDEESEMKTKFKVFQLPSDSEIPEGWEVIKVEKSDKYSLYNVYCVKKDCACGEDHTGDPEQEWNCFRRS